ncbi:pyrimidine dimer DNA glycosylase/endonuclease V [Patescibacteria group bacterium]|nr:pyrimidine dimer DNA glycosylase/endonuclease V [Patescibacteria group bacterium]
MRVWDIHVKHLCRKHLLGEHRELHGLWNILTKHGGKGGYSQHPETKRWVGKLKALYNRHEELTQEMEKRRYQHRSPLDKKLAIGQGTQKIFINTIREQKEILAEKPCECFTDKHTK